MRRRGGNLVFISQIPLTETNNLRDNRGPNAVTIYCNFVNVFSNNKSGPIVQLVKSFIASNQLTESKVTVSLIT